MKPARLPPLLSLRAFDAVARLTSFKLAGHEIGVTPTAISHQIRILEQALECRLFERSTKGVSLTHDGTVLFRATSAAFSTIRLAVEEITSPRPQGAVSLSTTSNFMTHWLIPRLPGLQHSCPDLELHLHTSTTLVDVSGSLADCAIRYSQHVNPTLANMLLYRDRFVLIASPALAITCNDDLQHQTLFHIDNRQIPQPSPDWKHWQQAFGPAELDIDSGIHFNDETHALQAAVAGQGVLIASELLARDALNKKILQAPLAQSLPGGEYYFVTSPEKQQWPEIQQLSRWLAEEFSTVRSANKLI